MRKTLLTIFLLSILVSVRAQIFTYGFVESDTNGNVTRPTNFWYLASVNDTNFTAAVRAVQNNGGGGGTGISTNGGSGINNTFTNATLAGQPMLPGWGSLSNPTGALLGVGSDGTFRVSPNLGWSVIGLTGNIDTNSSDGIITNDTRALTFTNSANNFGGNGGSLTGLVYTIYYTNSGPSGTNSAGTILTLNTNLTSGSSVSNAIVTVVYTNAGGSFTNASGTVLTLNTNAPGSGSVTAVTATSPLGATAGATPVISVASATGSGALVEQTGATIISPTVTNMTVLGPVTYNFTNLYDDFWMNADGSSGLSNIISGNQPPVRHQQQSVREFQHQHDGEYNGGRIHWAAVWKCHHSHDRDDGKWGLANDALGHEHPGWNGCGGCKYKRNWILSTSHHRRNECWKLQLRLTDQHPIRQKLVFDQWRLDSNR